MNIFILDYDMEKSVKSYCDKHVVKMQLEYAQLLSTTYWITNTLGFVPRSLTSEEINIVSQYEKLSSYSYYKPTHINHPCAIWTRSSLSNFDWLYKLALTLEQEWIRRYEHPTNKTHKAIDVIRNMPYPDIPTLGLTPFPQCMPDEYKRNDVVEAYRAYYLGDKKELLNWKNTEKPSWVYS